MQLTEKQTQLVNELAEDFRPIVETIEAGIATTKGNYGRYGALISQLAKGNALHAKVFSLALIKAGANSQGVNDGLRLLT